MRAFWARLRSAAIIFPKWKLSIGCSGDFFKSVEIRLLGARGLADRLLDRTQGVVEFAGQADGIHSFLQCDHDLEGFPGSVEIGVQDPRLVVDGLDRVRLTTLSTRSYCSTALANEALAFVRIGLALGDREQQVAQVDVSRRRVELGCGGFGVRQGRLELLRLVEADGDSQAHAALRRRLRSARRRRVWPRQDRRGSACRRLGALGEDLDQERGRRGVFGVGLEIVLQNRRGGRVVLALEVDFGERVVTRRRIAGWPRRPP